VTATETTGMQLAVSISMVYSESPLRYIDAAHVDSPVGNLNAIRVLSPSEGNVGKLDGLIIDPIERQVRYFVVESRQRLRARRYLVPVSPATIDPEHRTLHLEFESEDLDELPEVPSEPFRPYSDDDLLSALFAPRTE
jgi:hypothetical protein